MTLKWLPMLADSLENEKGFTLVEVMIAVAIFAIGFLAVASMQTNALMRTNSARQMTEAMSLAEAQVERLRSLPFYDPDEDLDGVSGNDTWDIVPELRAVNHPDADDNDDLSANTPYTVNWTVTDDAPLPPYSANVLTVAGGETRSKTIRVWVTRDNNPNEVEAEIIFAKFWAADAT